MTGKKYGETVYWVVGKDSNGKKRAELECSSARQMRAQAAAYKREALNFIVETYRGNVGSALWAGWTHTHRILGGGWSKRRGQF